MGEFDGLVAIVTGGASGIGAAATRLLRERGARVAVLDLAVPAAGTPFATDAADLAVRCDVGERASVDAAVATVIERFGRLDILVNNAGIGSIGDISSASDEEWERLLNVNVVGMARVARAALPHLARSPHAAIVNTSSVVAVLGVPQRVVYAATKGAVAAMTLAMAADHVGQGIRVNAVLPGTAATPWIKGLLDAASDPVAAEAALKARQPIGRLVSADEVAHAIVHLASPLAASTTGTLLGVDGGMANIRLPAKS